MDADVIHEEGVSGDDFNSMEPEAGSNRADILDGISSGGEVNGELFWASEILTRLELDLACSSEKLVNLSILTMHVATRETDFESFMSEKNFMLVDLVEKALEFDLLSGILDSEARELDKFMESIETDIVGALETISSFKYLGETFFKMEDKLHGYEESLQQSQDQVSEIKMQSADFQRILSCLFGNENWNDEKGVNVSEADQSSNNNAKIKMQTIEQQRHILRMLEKSLAREIDLEKKLAESRQMEEEMKPRLLSLEQGMICLEEEAVDVSERLFEADNAAAVLMGISKELLGRLQIVQFNLNSSTHRETELRLKLEDSEEKLEAKESALQKLESGGTRVNDFLLAQTDNLKAKLAETENKFILADSEAFTLREKVDLLEKQHKESEFNLLNAKASADKSREQCDVLRSEINELENVIDDLKDKLSKAEDRADNAEAKCKLLGEMNMELNEELGLLKSHDITSEKVEALERQLKESEIGLLNAVASAEASQEKQNMLYTTIGDMENLIEGLKLKLSKADNRADSAEDKCIILSETNAELSEELSFLRGRLDCLEASLNQAEEMKMATAKDIGIRTKLIANLLMQLAVERERLHQQISALALENKILVVKLKQTDKDPSIIGSHENRGNVKEFLFSKQDSSTASANEEITKLSADGSELDKTTESVGESEVKPTDATSEFENVRRTDARLLNFKHVSLALLILLISAAVYFSQNQECPF
ncbi:PREDICTED: WPP domain-interacting tail-anchored protein 1 isoform X2 [Theobroma cacao]|uniref:WPP domain-interacting tail-anchored protein 1 isoform X2 n=2 Tax=Theobroma cacao TaxID=3641 RepID=A0AB32V891_THECC|nr:PREDICTED: WPP domain-interacting tail-anchored protein 1 isoform X2 [Theobroma cacao]EOY03857.1 WPP domain-interacting protein 1, putative isoform 1 [Theobroma cacao]EOY03859.1 WPP domain-interacting protein 1, putative isoform 1 [Theobroma cacao]